MTTQPKVSRWRWFLIGGCGAILLILATCISVYFLMLGGRGGEPASANVAERVTKEFIQTLHDGDIEAAHRMFSEKIRPTTAIDDIIRFVRMDDNRVIFETYQSLQVCDWGFFITDDGRLISAKGLLHYESGDIVFESDSRQDSDGVWRVYGFWLEQEVEPKPFGHCH